jgi:hypothetical protein
VQRTRVIDAAQGHGLLLERVRKLDVHVVDGVERGVSRAPIARATVMKQICRGISRNDLDFVEEILVVGAAVLIEAQLS